MNGRRHRLAWIILLISFSACAGLILITPVGISTFIQRATRPLEVNVQANQGTVGILQSDNETRALFSGEPPQSLDEGGALLTNATDTALLLVYTPVEENLLTRMQVYGNTSVSVDRATSPRFQASSGNHKLALTLGNGRIHLTVPEPTERMLEIQLVVPQGEILIRESGQYSLITSNSETQISVLQGQALANSGNQSITLLTDERGVLQASEQIRGPLDTERNLLANGDFSRNWEEWVRLGPNVEISGQPPIELTISDESGESALRFERVGIGHADAGIRQIINQDVTDFESLRLVINMRIMNQSLGVCGQQGSECPLIIRIEYTDVNGVTQTWQQGLYSVGNVGPGTPDVCVACPPPLNEHEHVTYQQYVFYESENLLEKLGQLSILPRQIESITVIASGHSFEAELVDVALMVNE